MELSNRGSKRKGVAGVLSAVIFFAMLFTAGVGFFQAAYNDQNTSAQAYSQRLSLQAQASEENLSLMAGYGSGSGGSYIWLMANNTGGLDSSIKSVFVSFLNGSLLYPSPTGTPFLSTTPELNQVLPVTLDPGASTSAVSGNIEILPAALGECGTITSAGCSGQTVYVSVLTQLGNVFSVSFPAQASATEKNVIDGLVDEYVVTQNSNVVVQKIYEGCTGCVNGSYTGGNILVLLLTATPSPVQQGGTITVKATVSDYSAFSADSVSVYLNATYTGSATISPNIAPGTSPNYLCGSTPVITSGDSATVSCTFTASEGTLGGGTVAFAGKATACIATGSGTASPCSGASPGTPASSGVAGSNIVQVGAAASYGLWQPDFFTFFYTGCSGSKCTTNPSCTSDVVPSISQDCGAGVISSSEEYVAIFAAVTNEGTTPLTLLDGSYIQSVSPNVEFDLFMACSGASASTCTGAGPTYSASSGTINPYGCVDSAPSAPADSVSGQSCVTIQPGVSATLMFVASAPGTSTFEWGTSNPGGTGGEQAAILLDFADCTSSISVCNSGGGTYVGATQQIPFEGIVVP